MPADSRGLAAAAPHANTSSATHPNGAENHPAATAHSHHNAQQGRTSTNAEAPAPSHDKAQQGRTSSTATAPPLPGSQPPHALCAGLPAVPSVAEHDGSN